MNKADGKKLAARARRAIVREVEASQSTTLLATCDLLDHLIAEDPHALDTWHKLGALTEQQVHGIEHYLATRERFAEDPPWIERLRATVQRYYQERVRTPTTEPGYRERVLATDASVFALD